MWSWNRQRRDIEAIDAQVGDDRHCGACDADLAHCHATLVLHADGVLDCPDLGACGARPELHEWWIGCSDLALPCGCIGDEHPGAGPVRPHHLAQAA